MDAHSPTASRSDTARIEAFSDGVFAIVITLLVLDLKVPQLPPSAPPDALLPALLDEAPRLFAYTLSFLVIGLFWIGHHRTFRYIQSFDGTLLWLNLLLLLSVSFVPYPTAILSAYGGPVAVRFYAGTLAAAGLLHTLLWLYATTGRRHVARDLDARVVRYSLLRGIASLVVFGGSIAISYVCGEAAMYSWLLLPVTLAVLNRWLRAGQRGATTAAEPGVDPA